MTDTFGIAELAREFDVTTRTIRFYEDKGLLSPARKGQRRVYAPRDRVRLRLIMRGKRLGFSFAAVSTAAASRWRNFVTSSIKFMNVRRPWNVNRLILQKHCRKLAV